MVNVRVTKKRIAVGVGTALLATIATVTIASALTGSSAPITKFTGVDESASRCTTSTTFVNMPQANRSFTLGGSVNDEAVVMFSASMVAHPIGPADSGIIRLVVDGTVQSPVDLLAIAATGDQQTVSFNWQTRALTPGSHTASMQWRTNQGSTFCVAARSVIVLSK